MFTVLTSGSALEVTNIVFLVLIVAACGLKMVDSQYGEAMMDQTQGDHEASHWSDREDRVSYKKNSDHLQSHLLSRKKRFLMMNALQPNKAHQACLAPGGSPGHCRHLHHCVLPIFKLDFRRFMDYMCIIERSSIGVCCPDEVANRESSMPTGLAADLPSGALGSGENIETTASEDSNDSEESNQETRDAAGQNRGCGVASKPHSRITGGRPADKGEWPWMAALLRPPPARSFCGGVLVTDRHVLTAAHCVYRLKPSEVLVRLGEYDFNATDETRHRDFRVTEVRAHAEFDYSTYEHDIALLKIHRPATFNSYVWPICLPPVGETWENKSAIVTGWGTMYFGGPISDVLMEVGIPVWPQSRCSRAFTQRIQSTVLCAGGYKGGQDSCQGDSGGPLLHKLPNDRWVTIGIVSWGIRCGEPGHPGVYTRVNAYLRWIVENAQF